MAKVIEGSSGEIPEKFFFQQKPLASLNGSRQPHLFLLEKSDWLKIVLAKTMLSTEIVRNIIT